MGATSRRFRLLLTELVDFDRRAWEQVAPGLPSGLDRAAVLDAMLGRAELPLCIVEAEGDGTLEPVRRALDAVGCRCIIQEQGPNGVWRNASAADPRGAGPTGSVEPGGTAGLGTRSIGRSPRTLDHPAPPVGTEDRRRGESGGPAAGATFGVHHGPPEGSAAQGSTRSMGEIAKRLPTWIAGFIALALLGCGWFLAMEWVVGSGNGRSTRSARSGGAGQAIPRSRSTRAKRPSAGASLSETGRGDRSRAARPSPGTARAVGRPAKPAADRRGRGRSGSWLVRLKRGSPGKWLAIRAGIFLLAVLLLALAGYLLRRVLRFDRGLGRGLVVAGVLGAVSLAGVFLLEMWRDQAEHDEKAGGSSGKKGQAGARGGTPGRAETGGAGDKKGDKKWGRECRPSSYRGRPFSRFLCGLKAKGDRDPPGPYTRLMGRLRARSATRRAVATVKGRRPSSESTGGQPGGGRQASKRAGPDKVAAAGETGANDPQRRAGQGGDARAEGGKAKPQAAGGESKRRRERRRRERLAVAEGAAHRSATVALLRTLLGGLLAGCLTLIIISLLIRRRGARPVREGTHRPSSTERPGGGRSRE